MKGWSVPAAVGVYFILAYPTVEAVTPIASVPSQEVPAARLCRELIVAVNSAFTGVSSICSLSSLLHAANKAPAMNIAMKV